MGHFKNSVVITITSLILISTANAASPETQSLYKAKCSGCHGLDGTGTRTGKKIGAPDFTMPEIMKIPDDQLADFISKGSGLMPAFKDKLKEQEIRNMVAYLREFGKKK